MTFVLVSNDLTVLARVESAASRGGETVRITSTASQALETCRAESAKLLIVDLSMPTVDITELVKRLRSNATVPPRVIAFGPHVHEERLAAARSAGCDVVLSRGQFFGQLEAILGS